MNLSDIVSVSHAFFTRRGGVSEGIYASLNCGARAQDNAGNVDENHRRVAGKLGVQQGNLLSLYQIHSTDVITVTKSWNREERPQADAMVTNKPGIALGILTADCVPLLFADRKNGVIGAAHSGWKGALGGISQKTVKAMIALGAELETIAVAIGPAIAQQSYEVDSVFRQNFIDKRAGSARYFIPSRRSGHWMFDLKGFVRDSLKESGVKDINMLENDTYIEEDAFFSYRRATHRGEPDYGRQISAIMLNA